MHRPVAPKPTDAQTVRALGVIGRVLDADCAYAHEGAYWFVCEGGWTLAVSPDYAGRFRLTACYGTAKLATLWSVAGNMGRLAELAQNFKAEVLAVTREG